MFPSRGVSERCRQYKDFAFTMKEQQARNVNVLDLVVASRPPPDVASRRGLNALSLDLGCSGAGMEAALRGSLDFDALLGD